MATMKAKREGKHGSRRWTDAAKKRVLKYMANGRTNSETLAKYKISSSQLHSWKHDPMLNSAPLRSGPARATKVQRGMEMTQLVLAKKLHRLALERVKETDDLGDLELTAILLAKRLLGR